LARHRRFSAWTAVKLGQQGDGGMGGGVRVVPSPDHLHDDRRGVAQRPGKRGKAARRA
jgi:hypothetical protein